MQFLWYSSRLFYHWSALHVPFFGFSRCISPCGSVASALMHFSSEAFFFFFPPAFHTSVRHFQWRDFILVIYSPLSLGLTMQHESFIFPASPQTTFRLKFPLGAFRVLVLCPPPSDSFPPLLCHPLSFLLLSSSSSSSLRASQCSSLILLMTASSWKRVTGS